MYKHDVKGKTRQILGLQYEPYSHSSQYFLRRSSSSCSESLPSPSSSVPSVPSSPVPFNDEVFEKLRRMSAKFLRAYDPIESIMEAVSDAMDAEEHQQKIVSAKPVLEELPIDLQNVDISAFKRLVHSQPLVIDSRLFC